jgi:hypothetical protein
VVQVGYGRLLDEESIVSFEKFARLAMKKLCACRIERNRTE